MADPEDPSDQPEETVEIEVDLMEGKTNPMADLLASVPAVADMKLDMTKDEKLRTTALMMAVAYHRDTVVNDGELYQQMKMDQKTLTPTSAQRVVEYAWEFECFLRGESEVVRELEKKLFDRIEARLTEELAEEEQRDTTIPGSEP